MKRVFITGASGGIGLSLGKIFAENGYSVALGYFRHGERVEELARSLGEKGIFALPVGGDLSSYDQAKKAVEKVVSAFGGIDVLINNAGISQVGLFLDTTEESWRKIVDTNLSSAIYVTKFALEDMLKRGEGSIVNISSVWGLVQYLPWQVALWIHGPCQEYICRLWSRSGCNAVWNGVD